MMAPNPSRARIIDRLQKTRGNATLPPCPIPPTELNIPESERVDRLVLQLESLHAEVRRIGCADPEEAVLVYCRQRGINSLLVSARSSIQSGVTSAGLRIERFDRSFEEIKEGLFGAIDAGLTVADCAVAANGMLIHASAPEQPRTLSLVPPIHLCILDARRIHSDMATALSAEGWLNALPTNLIFISGPSKTADIQQTLAYGAHGPKELIVFIHGESA